MRDRGEVTVNLETIQGPRRQFKLRTSWEALAEIEDMTGQPIVPLFRQMFRGGIGQRNATALVFCGLKAAGINLKYEDVAEMVFRTGLADQELLDALGKFCEYALEGGRDHVDDIPDEPEQEEVEEAEREK